MTTVADRYFHGLVERLGQVRATQGAAIGAAAEACADSIAEGKLVFSFGTATARGRRWKPFRAPHQSASAPSSRAR